jgi:hypothetical protein
MKGYPVVAIFWEDHYQGIRSPIPKNPEEVIYRPTLTVGLLLSETEKCVLVASDIERMEEGDQATYTVILKTDIVGMKKYGKIKLENIRFT